MLSRRRGAPRWIGRGAVAATALVGLLAAATFDGGGQAFARPRPPVPRGNVPVVGGAKVDPGLGHRIAAVSSQLDRLARQQDRLDERYDVAVATAAAQQRSAAQARQDAQLATDEHDAAHRRFVVALTAQYESGTDASVGTLLTGDNPQRILDGLDVASYLSSQFATITRKLRVTATRAAAAQQRAQAALAAARVNQAALTRQKGALQRERQKFRQLFASLTARQRREVAHARAVAAAKARAALLARVRATGVTLSPVGVSAAVRRVIGFAEARVGQPYVFGAAGPTAYDCSGLTMRAWERAGVMLPHSAAAQYGYGTHVAYGHLRPGDLIFLYSPIDHVELYVGDDLAVSAADPALGIIYVHPSQDLADYAGATRLAASNGAATPPQQRTLTPPPSDTVHS